MKKTPIENDEQIRRYMLLGRLLVGVLALLVALIAALLWSPIVVGWGVLAVAYGVIRLIEAHRWHTTTIVTGISSILVGVFVTAFFSLRFLGVI